MKNIIISSMWSEYWLFEPNRFVSPKFVWPTGDPQESLWLLSRTSFSCSVRWNELSGTMKSGPSGDLISRRWTPWNSDKMIESSAVNDWSNWSSHSLYNSRTKCMHPVLDSICLSVQLDMVSNKFSLSKKWLLFLWNTKLGSHFHGTQNATSDIFTREQSFELVGPCWKIVHLLSHIALLLLDVPPSASPLLFRARADPLYTRYAPPMR